MKLKNLEEYKKKCPHQWKEWVGDKIVTVLYFNKQGLEKDKLKELTELNDSDFIKGLGRMIDIGDILFDENAKGRKYFIPKNLRGELDKMYNF